MPVTGRIWTHTKTISISKDFTFKRSQENCLSQETMKNLRAEKTVLSLSCCQVARNISYMNKIIAVCMRKANSDSRGN